MKATQRLHDLGQSIWLDNITRDLLTRGTLKCYIDALATRLQDEGAASFVKSWNELMAVIASKSAALEKAA
jgi:transaldolase